MSSYERTVRGPAYQKDSSIYSLFFGTRTKLLEDELNELQWNQVEISAELNRSQKTNGLMQPINAVTTATDNIFYFQGSKVLTVLVDGYILRAGSNDVGGQPISPSDDKLFVKLPKSPTTGTRTDLVMLEAWFEAITHKDDLRKFGGDTTPILQNNILDVRANVETARRIQFKWRLRTIAGASSPTTVEALKLDGSNSGVLFTSIDNIIYSANIGLQRDDNLDVKSEGMIYAIPLATVARTANKDSISESDINITIPSSSTDFADLDIKGSINVDKDANIKGDINAGGDIHVNGGITIDKNSDVKGDSSVGGDLFVDGEVVISGDLTVNGTTTYLNTTELQIKDNIITLNSGATGNPVLNAGLEVNRGDLPTVSVIWNESIDKWQLTTDGKNFYNIVTPNDNVASASKLQTPRTISLVGDVTGSVSFDGSSNVSINTVQKNSGVNAGTYTKVTVDAKGNVTAGTTLVASDIPNLDWSKITTGKPTTLAGYGITDAATSTHTHSWSSITNKPTTLAGFGITDAASSSHNHDSTYLKLSGGTVTGTLITNRLVIPVGKNMYA